MERFANLEAEVMTASREMAGRSPDMGPDYAKKGRVISALMYALIVAALLLVMALLYNISSYGPMGKGFAGFGLLWVGARAYSAFTQNRGY